MRTCGMARSHAKKAITFHSVPTLWRMMPLRERLKLRLQHRSFGALRFTAGGASFAPSSGVERREAGQPITTTLGAAQREAGAGTEGAPEGVRPDR